MYWIDSGVGAGVGEGDGDVGTGADSQADASTPNRTTHGSDQRRCAKEFVDICSPRDLNAFQGLDWTSAGFVE